MILATFAPPGAADTEFVPYFSYDGIDWTRADLRRRPGETITALGVRPSGHYLFVGTSEGRVLRRQAFSVPAEWEEVYSAPEGTFQPAVTGFAFLDDHVYVSVKGLLYSSTGLRFTDWTPGLGDLDPAIDRRGRFGTSDPAPIGDRVILGIGGLLPGSTGTWVRTVDGRWERTDLRAESRFAVVGGEVVAITAIDAAGVAPAHVSRDQGRTWIEAATNAPDTRFTDVSASGVGAIAMTGTGLYRLGPDLAWQQLASLDADRPDFAVSGRDVFVPYVAGLRRFRIERPMPSGATFCGVEQTRQGREPYAEDRPKRDCLWSAYLSGTPARLISYAYTVEGDPVVKTLTVSNGKIEIALESDDGFGFRGDVELVCSTLARSGPEQISLEATSCTGQFDRVHL